MAIAVQWILPFLWVLFVSHTTRIQLMLFPLLIIREEMRAHGSDDHDSGLHVETDWNRIPDLPFHGSSIL